MTNDWKQKIRLHALAMRVLAVATTRVEGTWKAYIDAVPGINHNEEYDEVLRVGDTLGEDIAKSMFPEFKDIPYAR